MKILFSLSEATETIRHNKFRTFLTMLGMNIGVGAIIAIISIGLMARTSIMEGVGELGAALIIVQPEYKSYDDQERPLRLAPEDGTNLARLFPEETVLPYLQGSADTSARGLTNGEQVFGVGEDYNLVWNRELEAGRFFGPEDHHLRRKVAVIGSRIARKYFGTGEAVGETLRVGAQVYTVVGVLNERGRETMNDGTGDTTIYLPLETYQSFFNHGWYGRPYLNYLLIRVENMDRINEIVSKTEIYLFSRYGFKNGEPRFRVSKSQDDINTFNKVFDVITLVISLIAGLSLLVSGMGIMNIMLVAITERTREIGIRKSLGARRRDILEQFLIEAIIICLLGGGIGVILGMLISFLVALSQSWSYLVPLFSVAAGLGVSLAIGLFFGIYPAMRAARMDPIKALSRD